MKVYISGRISGLPYEEVERKFAAAEAHWTGPNFLVLNPLKNGLDRSASWEEHMVADIRMLMEADKVVMLSDWKESRGARIEEAIARILRKTIVRKRASY